ncbi:hypothetical protein EYR40_004254 [Pleurotus pulmonarius]|nr:hypothetical protein EYR36_007175 [Pleurotus pulmonarius]KAF4605470.1 hypothetical protein EYR40_004254 [Pleurotus pulmonarius]KAF4606959.1 hypothetical protein EYR38_001014 [Pleurotus pulmonarius]
MIAALQTETTTMAPNGNANGSTEQELQSQQLLAVARTVLEQAVDLVDNYLTSDDQLTVHSKSLPGSTIGKHLRHARDHFVLLVESVSSGYVLNYDVRSRNTPMESSLSEARVALIDAVTRLEKVVPQVDIHQRMILNAITPYPQTLETTFGRELWFAALHCIHHWSMVRVIAGELDIKLTDDFGFAPSTLVHQGKEAPLGKAKI